MTLSVAKQNLSKWALLASIFFSGAGFAQMSLADLDCGEYLARGLVHQNDRGHILLTLNAESTSPQEFLLLARNAEVLIDWLDQSAEVVFRLPLPVRNNRHPYALVRSIRPITASENSRQKVDKIKTVKCPKSGEVRNWF